MKHLISPIANGGAPIYLDDLINSDLQNKQAYEAILAGLDSKIVLSGCDVTVTGPGTADITAGYVYLNGTVMEVGAYSGTTPIFIHEAAAVNDDRDFEDGNTDTVATTQSAEFTGSPSGTSIEFNPETGYRLDTVIRRASYGIGDIRLLTVTTDKFDVTGLGLDTSLERGFSLCNGNNGTPDLSGKFIVGLGTGDYGTVGNTGGEEEHTLTLGEMPPHSHNLVTTDAGAANYNGSGYVPSGNPGTAGAIGTSSQGSGDAHENRPPYYVLAYVMKVS
jgi:hypothetical protein